MKMNKHTTDREISQILLGRVSIFQIWQSKPSIYSWFKGMLDYSAMQTLAIWSHPKTVGSLALRLR